MTLQNFIPATKANYVRPWHLARLTERLEEIGRVPHRIVVERAPRCGITETLLASMLYLTKLDPSLTFAYMTYHPDVAKSLLGKLDLAINVRSIHPMSATHGWRCSGAVFIDGYTGYVDGRPDLDGAAMWAWVQDAVLTRLLPVASVFIINDPEIINIRPQGGPPLRAARLGDFAIERGGFRSIWA